MGCVVAVSLGETRESGKGGKGGSLECSLLLSMVTCIENGNGIGIVIGYEHALIDPVFVVVVGVCECWGGRKKQLTLLRLGVGC